VFVIVVVVGIPLASASCFQRSSTGVKHPSGSGGGGGSAGVKRTLACHKNVAVDVVAVVVL
jgi:hypothetical protein